MLGALVRVKLDSGIPLMPCNPAIGGRNEYSSRDSGICPVQGKFCPRAPVKGENL